MQNKDGMSISLFKGGDKCHKKNISEKYKPQKISDAFIFRTLKIPDVLGFGQKFI